MTGKIMNAINQFPSKMIFERYGSNDAVLNSVNELKIKHNADDIGLKITPEKAGYLTRNSDSKGFYAVTVEFSGIAAKTSEIETKRRDFLEEAEKYFNNIGTSFNSKNISRNKLVINDGAPYEEMFKLAYKDILWKKPWHSFF
ncbi:MAG: hypothetical protein KKB25_01095 [Nanoarchaeota archaeon]|nr:hypothetical protein [Nanoarchaeota archaeon]